MSEFEGFHGTDRARVESILANNFHTSHGHNGKYGEGAYFFVSGINLHPQQDARDWAKRTAYDKKGQGPTKFEFFTVLKVSVEAEEASVWDLRTEAGKRDFQEARQVMLEDLGEGPDRVTDEWIFQQISKSKRFQFIVVECYTKFLSDLRSKSHSQMPNTTILCVCDAQKSISLDAIKVVEEGPVEE